MNDVHLGMIGFTQVALTRMRDEMFRVTIVVMLSLCLAATRPTRIAGAQDSAGQAPHGAKAAAGQSAVVAPENTYPLDAFTDFSAVMVGTRVEPGEGAEEGYIYRSGNLMRMEDPGRLGYYITDLARGETYGISEMGCLHDGHPFIRAFPFDIGAKPGITVTRALVGSETFDGHKGKIEDVTVEGPTFANPLKMRFWEAEDLRGFPIKMEFLLPGGRNAIVRYKNVVLGPQDPTLFLHPKSCASLKTDESTSKPPAHKKPAAE